MRESFFMQWIEQFQFFLFDFDGVLVDTEPLHYEAYAQMCQKRGIPWTWSFEQYCKEAHGQAQGIKKALYAQCPDLLQQGPAWEVLAGEKKEIYTDFLSKRPLKLMPGVEDVLCALERNHSPRCVVTNSSSGDVEKIKNLLPVLQSIPHWITRKDYEHPKPSPEGYRKAIAHYASPEWKMIGFEDTYKGFLALSQTPAYPVLICPAFRDHISTCCALGGEHFESFEKMNDGILKSR